MVEPTHLKKCAQVKLDHFPKFRGTNMKKPPPSKDLGAVTVIQPSFGTSTTRRYVFNFLGMFLRIFDGLNKLKVAKTIELHRFI